MLVFLCVQIMQTNNNDPISKKEKKITIFYCKQAKNMQACQESKIKKSSCQNTQGINHNLLQV
jgi:hypothetical protein